MTIYFLIVALGFIPLALAEAMREGANDALIPCCPPPPPAPKTSEHIVIKKGGQQCQQIFS